MIHESNNKQRSINILVHKYSLNPLVKIYVYFEVRFNSESEWVLFIKLCFKTEIFEH